MVEKFARQEWRRVLAGFFGEALRERKQVPFGEIEFHALDAMHGEEDYTRGEGLAILDLRGEIVETRKVDAAQRDSFGGKMENGAPEFFARVA
jgi:hypothetical protein